MSDERNNYLGFARWYGPTTIRELEEECRAGRVLIALGDDAEKEVTALQSALTRAEGLLKEVRPETLWKPVNGAPVSTDLTRRIDRHFADREAGK